MLRVNRTISCLLAVWLLTTTVGCATINLSKIDFRSRKATAHNPAIKIVCLWEPAEGRDPKGIPCQGFAGQILFLTGKSLPVSVQGDVKVYLFDDHGTSEEQAKPLHEFNFDSEAWTQHYSYGSLGPCYNVFIPYMRKGVNDATCALRLRLTPPENQGPALFSEMTSIELFGNGDARKGPAKSSTNDSRVEQTTPEDLTSTNNRRRTTTIVLNAKDGVPGNATENPKVSPKSEVQQASYQPDAKPLTEADARMAQLEQMVQQLQALQQKQPVPAAKPTAPTLPATPPRLLDEAVQQPVENRTRLKMRSMESASDEEAGTVKLQQLADEPDDEPTPRHKPATVERRVHPLLEDDSPAAPRTSTRASAARRLPDVTLDEAPKKRKVQGHPLDDDYEQVVQPVVHRKVIRTVELGSKPEPKRKAVEEAFEPIETDRAEASASEESPPVRVRLRAAN